MSKPERYALLVIAIAFGGCFPFAVLMFGASVGDAIGIKDLLLFFLVTIIVSSPIWLAAIIPAKYKYLSMFFRWVSAVVLLTPVYFYLTSELLKKGFSFLMAGNWEDALFHVPIFLVILLCINGAWILLKSDLSSCLNSINNHD